MDSRIEKGNRAGEFFLADRIEVLFVGSKTRVRGRENCRALGGGAEHFEDRRWCNVRAFGWKITIASGNGPDDLDVAWWKVNTGKVELFRGIGRKWKAADEKFSAIAEFLISGDKHFAGYEFGDE